MFREAALNVGHLPRRKGGWHGRCGRRRRTYRRDHSRHGNEVDRICPGEWGNESFAIAKAVSTGYCVVHGTSCDLPNGSHVTIDAAYLDTNKPIVREQLQKAGVRLARILDIAFGN
jgi:hypothetical protein